MCPQTIMKVQTQLQNQTGNLRAAEFINTFSLFYLLDYQRGPNENTQLFGTVVSVKQKHR